MALMDGIGYDSQLGKLLVERGYLTPEQLEEALQVQARPGETRMLGQILISRGYVKKHHITLALAKQDGRA